MNWLMWKPVVALLGVMTLQPNDAHITNMNGVQLEGQTSLEGFGAYVTATSSELYTGGIQFGAKFCQRERLSCYAQVFLGASYPSRWVPELPNEVQFDTGVRLAAKVNQLVVQLAWQHDSGAGLGKEVRRGNMIYGNTGLDLIKFGFGWEF